MAPIRFRSMIVATATLFCSISGFVVTKTFEDGRNLVDLYGLFWLYSGSGLHMSPAITRLQFLMTLV
ncbi:hypothetical protein CEXT_395361 [Caerostris extrusa]|uniref:Uncharacterized protein n=1 Tax=Caerostris extrusa TaxID=172846 RepID=A0AAV4XDD9_CAEEX|nr:hypothetical protein CEXT_395361 [Caerostris extrusa]